jgi:aminopeptidase YwaD
MHSKSKRSLAARVTRHLRQLCVEIGSRPGGSAANADAERYIREIFESCGLNVESQEFGCQAWDLHACTVTTYDELIDAGANPFSPSCDIRAPATVVATMEQLEHADLEGRIAILAGDLVREPLAPVSWFLTSERDKRIVGLLESKRPLAVVMVQQRTGELEHLIEDPDFAIPSVTVASRAGLSLLSASDPVVRIRVDSERREGQAANVIGRASSAGRSRILTCAHYDTKFDTPGALDNAGGVAVLLALAEELSGREVDIGLEIIAFSNEERVPEGMEPNLAAYGASLRDVVALMNFDGVGHALDVDTVALLNGSTRLQSIVEDVRAGFSNLVWSEP